MIRFLFLVFALPLVACTPANDPTDLATTLNSRVEALMTALTEHHDRIEACGTDHTAIMDEENAFHGEGMTLVEEAQQSMDDMMGCDGMHQAMHQSSDIESMLDQMHTAMDTHHDDMDQAQDEQTQEDSFQDLAMGHCTHTQQYGTEVMDQAHQMECSGSSHQMGM